MKGLKHHEYSLAIERFRKWKKEGVKGADAGLPELLEELNSIPQVIPLWSCIGHPDRPGSQPYITFGVKNGDAPGRYADEIMDEIFVSGILKFEYGLMVAPWHEDEDYIMAEDMLEFTIPTFTIRGTVMGDDVEQNKMAKELFISNIQSIIMKLEAYTGS
ncbi:hypothetical protein CPT_Moabite_226 [Serratia phage Moabite]|uniref:Uncharacterized protein n=1 Tax=Serratia phage Moabite TaxID=2587814 RepID=A0A4Y5TPH8_9CAUD|nr:hypothetical protein HWC48_gp190 [Serratia phage Moabite]QDB71256.1 hypothetical protein CPT_Moabite_226 [Serratia phage Moabite]